MTETRPQPRWPALLGQLLIAGMIGLMLAAVLINAKYWRVQFSNTNLAAPFSVAGFLAAGAGLALALLVIVVAMMTHRRVVAQWAALVAITGTGLYVAMLLGYSWSSRSTVLQLGQEKYFCEMDCHLAYSVTGETRNGQQLTVKLRTHFDERTISPWRGDSPLQPGIRDYILIDSSGHRFRPSRVAGADPTTPLRPGQSYTTELVFDLPSGSRESRLAVLASDNFPERLMIGNENSFWHAKILFAL